MASDKPFVIAIEGSFDQAECARLSEMLLPSLFRPNVVVDFYGVRAMDAACVSEFLKIRKRRQAFGFAPKHFARVPKAVKRLFDEQLASHVWRFYSTVEEAAAAFHV